MSDYHVGMASKKDLSDRQMENNRKMDPNDYDSLISQHSIFEAAKTMKQPNLADLAGFSGYSNAETQTKSTDLRTQTAQSNIGPWHYNPWWMLAGTSRTPQSQDDFSNGAEELKVKEEPEHDTPEHEHLQNELEHLGEDSQQTIGLDAFCDECSDPFCDSSSGICRKLFHCPHCRKSYPTVLEFNTHLTGVHPAQKPFRCQICLEPYDKKAQLRRHLDGNHTRKDVNKCSVCSKYIKDKSNLRKHMQVHTGRVPQKQFKCDLCNNKRYMSLDRLNNHRVVCTGEKVLKYCDMCSKVFDNSRSLNSHKKVHARELKCDGCGEQYRALDHLNAHKLSCRNALANTSGVPNLATNVSALAAAAVAANSMNRCCSQPSICDHDKPSYLNIPGYAGRALDATLTTLKTQMN